MHLPPLVTLLTTQQHKLDKGLRKGFASAGITLAPGKTPGLGTVCASSGMCEEILCLEEAGRNALPTAGDARYRRTLLFRRFTRQFFEQATAEITLWAIQMQAQGFKLCFRPNILSDLPAMAQDLARRFPHIQMYDYSKHPNCHLRTLPNYHLTYSYNEKTTGAHLDTCIQHKTNIAVVFALKRADTLPKTVELHGRTFKVLDGDVSDLRFLDKSDRAYVIGLRWKTSRNSQAKLARAIAAGFVIDPAAQAASLRLRRAA